MDFQQGFNRSQLMMLDFESMVSSDSWARIVDLYHLSFEFTVINRPFYLSISE